MPAAGLGIEGAVNGTPQMVSEADRVTVIRLARGGCSINTMANLLGISGDII